MKIAAAQPFTCPLCSDLRDHARVTTCQRCRGWWVDPGRLGFERYEASGSGASGALALRLPARVPWGSMVVVAALGALCLGAIGLGLAAVLQRPTALSSWGQLVLGLPLWIVGPACLACVVAWTLHARSPSRLVGDDHTLRLRVWRTWEGTWAALHRLEPQVPRADLHGVALVHGQGGATDTQLFLLHRSGLALGTGWSGTTEQARAHGAHVVAWLEGRADDGPAA
jgi:hypothetical protein